MQGGEIGGGIQLDGMQVYDRAVRMMTDTIKRLSDDAVAPTVAIGHQANSRILQKVREHADIGDAVFVDCVEQFGNTSSASIPPWRSARACPSAPSRSPAEHCWWPTARVRHGGGVAVDYDLTDAYALGGS